MSLRPYQLEARDAVHAAWDDHRSVLLVMATGCHRAGQLVMRYDGSLVAVEDVIPGDQLMGPDSTPRTVLSLCRGRDEMRTIVPGKGEPWTVNRDHVLTLIARGCREILDVSVREWETWGPDRKRRYELFRVYLGGAPGRIHVAQRTSFGVKAAGVEDYYGFAIDGDRRYLLDDFTVTHNTGKTYTAGEILRERARHGRILWLAHRTELLKQARTTIEERIELGCDLEKAQDYAPVLSLFGSPVVVASVQTLRAARLKRWPGDTFKTVVVDEAHHAAAKGYREILDHFGDAKVLGLTATPDRGDGVALGHVFDHVAMDYDIRTAITEGYLCPIRQMQIQCADLDISDVKTVAGDLAQGELEKRLRLDAVLHQVAAPLVKEAGERPTIVFTAGVAQAHALVDVLAGYAPVGAAVAIDGTTEPALRAERLARFASGDVQFLVNCSVLSEGFDAPSTACIAIARPTKSRALYTQMIGRGTRIAEGKADCLVLDFVGNSGRHKLVNPIDVLGGADLPEDIAARAKELCSEGQPSEEALAQAEAEAEEQARRDEERLRREAKVRAQVAYRARKVDPFGVIGCERGPRATPAQLGYLAKLKVELRDHVPSRREASTLIDTIKRRQKQGLCSYKQAKLLASKGLDPDLDYRDARDCIDALAANGWRVSDAILAEYGAEVAA